jgi:hypothetical protein
MTLALAAAERGWLPDGLIRLGIRSLLRGRLELERRRTGGDLEQALDAYLLRHGRRAGWTVSETTVQRA